MTNRATATATKSGSSHRWNHEALRREAVDERSRAEVARAAVARADGAPPAAVRTEALRAVAETLGCVFLGVIPQSPVNRPANRSDPLGTPPWAIVALFSTRVASTSS